MNNKVSLGMGFSGSWVGFEAGMLLAFLASRLVCALVQGNTSAFVFLLILLILLSSGCFIWAGYYLIAHHANCNIKERFASAAAMLSFLSACQTVEMFFKHPGIIATLFYLIIGPIAFAIIFTLTTGALLFIGTVLYNRKNSAPHTDSTKQM